MKIFDNNLINLAVSVIFVFALLSIIVSMLVEWYNYRVKARAVFLQKAIYKMLKDPINYDFGHLFYNHFMIRGLMNDNSRFPQYISSEMFAEVLIDIIANLELHKNPIILTTDPYETKATFINSAAQSKTVMERFSTAVQNLNPSPFSDHIISLYDKAIVFSDTGRSVDIEKSDKRFRTLLSLWYDGYMDRVSGWYKAGQRKKMLAFGVVVALALNLDSIHLVRTINMNDVLKNNLVAAAITASENEHPLIFSDSTLKDAAYKARIDSVLEIAGELNLPMGWDASTAPVSWFHKKNLAGFKKIESQPNSYFNYIQYRNNKFNITALLTYLLGLTLSSIALSFGAPFWFDVLKKAVNIRTAGIKPKSTTSDDK
jgi:hypothetical protein